MILNLRFQSNHLDSHFLLIPLRLILNMNNILFFLQAFKKRNEILRKDTATKNIHPQGDHRRQRASSTASTILLYP
jgi:alpha-N-acetylglucosamine transferase